jgi:hypothetical protein
MVILQKLIYKEVRCKELCVRINIPKLPDEAAGNDNLIATNFGRSLVALVCGVIEADTDLVSWGLL